MAVDALIERISQRVGHYLERAGLLVRDIVGNCSCVALPPASMQSYRIAMGPRVGRKAFTLQTLPARADERLDSGLATVAGFSLHCGVAAGAHQREKLERLCRYISRPALATERLSLTRQGNVRYRLRTPYRDGTTHIILEPLDFIARLAALVPTPRVNLTRFHIP